MARYGGLDSAIGDDPMFGSIFRFAAKRFQLPFQLGRLSESSVEEVARSAENQSTLPRLTLRRA
jgi:hypothetical protein